MGRNETVLGSFILSLLLLFAHAGSSQAARTPAFDSLHQWYVDHYPFFSMEDTVYTFEGEYELPEGFTRPDSTELTPFQFWVSHFPLWHRHKPIGQWRGGRAFQADEVSRAVHLPWRGRYFRDYAIPFRVLAEYLFYQNRRHDLRVIPPLGDTLRYEDWLTGRPATTAQGEIIFQPAEKRDPGPYEYYAYLAFIMRSTSYRDLAQNCDSIQTEQVAPGDLFIAHDQKNRSGVVYVVLNMLCNDRGQRLYTVATGCAEACDFHIPKLNSDRHNPWVTIEQIQALGAEFSHAGFFRLKIR
ncbi:MAG: DUF4846 domain-containing protein [Candidatus Zixiibacteriota bacterium]